MGSDIDKIVIDCSQCINYNEIISNIIFGIVICMIIYAIFIKD